MSEFGKVVKIWFIVNHSIYFALHVGTTLNFNEDLNAFEIKETDLRSPFPRILINHES